MTRGIAASRGRPALHEVVVAALIVLALMAIFLVAPNEETMGSVQRIMYVHIAVAWLGLLGMVVVAAMGLMYLARRGLTWDHAAQAAAEQGWLCCTLTLVTGSLWASEAWNTWWTWDPRLTSVFVLWLIYSGYLLMRANVEDPQRRARLGAVVAIFGAIDIPLVVMATRWFRGIHPVSPRMEPMMRVVLLLTAVSFTAFFALLVFRRWKQLGLERLVASMERCWENGETIRFSSGALNPRSSQEEF